MFEMSPNGYFVLEFLLCLFILIFVLSRYALSYNFHSLNDVVARSVDTVDFFHDAKTAFADLSTNNVFIVESKSLTFIVWFRFRSWFCSGCIHAE